MAIHAPTFFVILSLPMPATLVELKPLTLGQWGKCSTTMPLIMTIHALDFLPYYLSQCLRLQWTQTLVLRMVRRVFYNCATAVDHPCIRLVAIFSLPVSSALTGLKPLTLGWLGWCSTTGQPWIKIFPFPLFWFSTFGLDSNTGHWENETSVLLLCCHCWPSKP